MKKTLSAICLLAVLLGAGPLWAQTRSSLLPSSPAGNSLQAGFGMGQASLTVLPNDGRSLYFQAIDSAQHEIRIEICVLEDPQILEHIQAALERGVTVRAIVDAGKYDSLQAERDNLAMYLTDNGGQLHLSNPVFPRSFPKIILVDSSLMVYGSACLDETTFQQYRDFATTTTNPQVVRNIQRLFENDWTYSAAPGEQPPPFDPTPPISTSNLIVSPVNGAAQLVQLYQSAKRTLDVYTELLGNPTLEGELVAAVKRGVKVKLIAPEQVNGATNDVQTLQCNSLAALSAAGVDVHVSGPNETAEEPYMHARAAVVDGKVAYLGSLSLSPDSITFNREMGMILQQPALVQKLEAQFQSDYNDDSKTTKFPPGTGVCLP